MTRRTTTLILTLTFTESFATVLLERGIYFFTHDRLGFSTTQNLLLALAFGLCYAAGATGAHPLTHKLGERRLFALLTVLLLVAHAALGLSPTAAACAVGFPLVGLLSGMKWPVVETYVTAGRTPKQAIRAIGGFNVAWAASVPLALLVTGPLIEHDPRLLFALAVAIHATTLLLLFGLPSEPAHLDLDHPERPDPATLARYVRLQTSARWAMLGSYAMLFLLAPLLPEIFAKLGHGVKTATGLSAGLDVARLLTFAVLGVFTGWRGKTLPLAAAVVALPFGLFVTLFAPTTAGVLLGEAVFGVASGMIYYAALYHAMVLLNASIKAGSAHESLIGLGFALGPAAGLVAAQAGNATGSTTAGLVLMVGPLALVTSGLALRPLRRCAA